MRNNFLVITTISLCALFSSSLFAENNAPQRAKDMGVVNKDRILYWLEKRGEISANASTTEKENAVRSYIGQHNDKPTKLKGELAAAERVQHFNTLKKMSSRVLELDKNALQKIQPLNKMLPANTTVKVLAIMIDFPDLKFNDNRLTNSDTDMYYSNYSKSHYHDLLFSSNGYDGPSGQNIESAYQYYQQESGQSFSFTGNTYGWVTADNNASYYGANNNNGNDANVGELVIEAVSKAVSDHNLDLSEYDQTDYFDRDNDGIINEPNGIIDHVMVFHSSIGEEAGGGVLGSEAIWSHRFFVFDDNNLPIDIPGSDIKLFGYTINPIDSATGVVVHEFGHDLGVPDEYDTKNTDIGSPVSGWSVMASGSWLGTPRGTRPSSFSPYAQEYFQNRYGGSWINQEVVELTENLNESITINSATEQTSGIDQIRVNLPNAKLDFGIPYAGFYQYHSDSGDMLTSKFSFNTTLGAGAYNLTMMARWDIEDEWDYVQVKVNDEVISGNHTRINNTKHPSINNYISGQSTDIDGANSQGWVELTFSLLDYSNENINIEIEYKTDAAEGGYGFVVDEIKVSSLSNTVFSDGGEFISSSSLDGFNRIDSTIEGKDQYYYIQLRNHEGTDSALSSIDYNEGVLLWYANNNIDDNDVSLHPGEVFLGVVDADQNIIKSGSFIFDTERQLRDAAFSMFNQTSSFGDNDLNNNLLFDDSNDYSAPEQKQSGIMLPTLGFTMEVTSQDSSSSTATVKLNKIDVREINATQSGLTVNLSLNDSKADSNESFVWNLGDSTQLTGQNISHTYTSSGSYNISISYTNQNGSTSLNKTLSVAQPIEGTLSLTASGVSVNYSANLTGGSGTYIYRWIFGDNEGASSQTTGSYTYNNAGTYTVELNVTDDTGVTYSFTGDVTVQNPLTASFNTTTSNLSVTLSNNGTGGTKPYTYLWNFGDNNTSTDANPSHTYTTAGTYTITLSITDQDDNIVTATRSVSVSAPSTNNVSSSSSESSSGGALGWLILFLTAVTSIRLKYEQNEQG